MTFWERVDEAIFVLCQSHERSWVLGLCPADLWHYHAVETTIRNERLREQLHVMAAAATVTVDQDGTVFRRFDERLAPPKAKQAPKRGGAKEDEAKPRRVMPAEVAVRAESARAAAMKMWGGR